jgi:hypothetical protein
MNALAERTNRELLIGSMLDTRRDRVPQLSLLECVELIREVGPRTAAAKTESSELFNESAAVIDDGDAAGTSRLGDRSSKRFGQGRVVIQHDVPRPEQ